MSEINLSNFLTVLIIEMPHYLDMTSIDKTISIKAKILKSF